MEQHHTRNSLAILEAEARERQREEAERQVMAWARKQRMRTMTAIELSAAMVRGTMVDVPAPPQTMDEVLRMQEQARRRLISDVVAGEADTPTDTLGQAVQWRERHWGKSGL